MIWLQRFFRCNKPFDLTIISCISISSNLLGTQMIFYIDNGELSLNKNNYVTHSSQIGLKLKNPVWRIFLEPLDEHESNVIRNKI